jgi:hypothetical protein
MKISNSDFWVLAGILSTVAGIGIYEGCELSPVFYSQPLILFGGLCYFAKHYTWIVAKERCHLLILKRHILYDADPVVFPFNAVASNYLRILPNIPDAV